MEIYSRSVPTRSGSLKRAISCDKENDDDDNNDDVDNNDKFITDE